MCVLKRRWDGETALHRWSMSLDERCLCLGVVAPQERDPPRECPLIRGAIDGTSNFWFTDSQKNIARRCNWTPEILNKLLERAEYCGEYVIQAHVLRFDRV